METTETENQTVTADLFGVSDERSMELNEAASTYLDENKPKNMEDYVRAYNHLLTMTTNEAERYCIALFIGMIFGRKQTLNEMRDQAMNALGAAIGASSRSESSDGLTDLITRLATRGNTNEDDDDDDDDE